MIKKIFQPLYIPINHNRIYGLDILRAFAIFFVLLNHSSHLLPVNSWIRSLSIFFQFDGVTIFFVLSGFLIGGILLKDLNKTKNPTFKNLFHFWIRRWFRTLPNYYFVLILYILLIFLIQEEYEADFLWKYFLFIQNFIYKIDHFFGESWSLSVEEWFYLLTPLFIYSLAILCKLKPQKAVLSIAIFVILFGIIYKIYIYLTMPNELIHTYDSTIETYSAYIHHAVLSRLDSINYGIIGAYFLYYHKELFLKRTKTLFFIGITIILADKYLIPGDFYKNVFSFIVMSIGTLLLIPFLSTIKNGKGPVFKTITYLSITSYSIYLLNFTLVKAYIIPISHKLLNNSLTDTTILALDQFTFWFFSIFLAILLYKYYEHPMTNLRERFKK